MLFRSLFIAKVLNWRYSHGFSTVCGAYFIECIFAGSLFVDCKKQTNKQTNKQTAGN